MRFADQRAAELNEQSSAAECPGCPRPLQWISCPHGCGLRYLAPDQKLTAAQFWRYGSWRMNVHLAGRAPGSRCVAPLFDGPVSFDVPTIAEEIHA